MVLLVAVSKHSRRRSCSCLPSNLVDILEIFGSHFELPELGPLGTHGLANVRDFESPVASFDIDQSPWESELHIHIASCTYISYSTPVVYKVSGKLHACHQEHTPFDIVAWWGK